MLKPACWLAPAPRRKRLAPPRSPFGGAFCLGAQTRPALAISSDALTAALMVIIIHAHAVAYIALPPPNGSGSHGEEPRTRMCPSRFDFHGPACLRPGTS